MLVLVDCRRCIYFAAAFNVCSPQSPRAPLPIACPASRNMWRRCTRALVAAAASVCSGNSNASDYSAAAAAAAANDERAAECYAGLLHVTALLNNGLLQDAEVQVVEWR